MDQEFSAYQHIVVPVIVLEASPANEFSILGVNEAWTITSELSEAQCLGRDLAQLFGERSTVLLNQLGQALIDTGACQRSICHFDLPQGESWFDVSMRAAPNAANGATRIVATLYDITDQQEVKNRAVQHYTHHLEVTQRMEQFMSFAAHDLRSPMRNVHTLAEMLRDDFVDHGDGKLEIIDMLEDIAVQASRLVDDVLNYARTTDLSETQSTLEFQDVCTDIALMLDPQGLHQIDCDMSSLACDPIVLRVLLQNLIDNAIKYSDGPAHITLKAQMASSGFVRLTVTDRGQGFDDPSMVFLNKGAFKVDSGFGLFGLKRLIEDRGGRIWAMPPKDGIGAVILAEIPGHLLKMAA